MKQTLRLIMQTTAALLLLTAIFLPAYGQRGGAATGRPARSGRTDPLRHDGSPESELEREMRARQLEETGSRRPDSQARQRLPFEQLSEDFTRIQVVNNDLVRAASRSDALDFKFVAKSTSEVRKLAERLKDNLVLPEPEKGFKPTQALVSAEAEQLKLSLLALGELIAGFAHNPVFKEVKVVDAQLSAKARRDLEEIIELSGQVRKCSEKLSKSAQKNH